MAMCQVTGQTEIEHAGERGATRSKRHFLLIREDLNYSELQQESILQYLVERCRYLNTGNKLVMICELWLQISL